MAPIVESYCPPNLPLSSLHADIVRSYIQEEVRLGRFSSPLTKEQMEAKIGPFRSSPIQLVIKPGAPGEPDKPRVCRNLSYRGKYSYSINDQINSDDFPTRWGTASEVAEIVRIFWAPPLPSLLFLPFFTLHSSSLPICSLFANTADVFANGRLTLGISSYRGSLFWD